MKTLHILRYISFCLALAVSSMAHAQCPNLVWSDEFNGTELDLSKWEPQIGDGCNYGICQWGNNELQFYKAENAVVSDGTLKILIKQEKNRRYNYTSARLRTKGLADFTYSRFEARMKLLQGQGLWPAFWMLSSNEPRGGWPQSGEIDIMEFLGQDPKKVFGTVHYGDPYPNNQYQSKDFLLYGDETFADDFHVFAVEWEPGEIRWYVDDILYSTKTADDVAPYDWPFDPIDPDSDPPEGENLMHLLLNVAVGGNLPGSPDATTPFPNQVEIDWVRVYDNSAFKPSISGDRLVSYQSGGHIYTLNNAPSGASIDWSVPAGAIINSGQGTDTVTVDWNDTGGYVVADVTDGCGTKAYRIDVTVESPFVQEFSFENFDGPASATLLTATGTLDVTNNPYPSGINSSQTIAQYVRNPAEQYDTIFYSTASILDASLYESGAKKFYMDVRSTTVPIGTQVLVQLEDSSQAGPSNYPTGRHSRYVGTVTRNDGEWERIVFDYLDSPDGSTPDSAVDQIILLFAPDSFTGDTYDWDNFDSYVVEGTPSNIPPTAEFSYAATDLTVDFDGSASTDDGSIISWDWDFGDGVAGSGQSAHHAYGSPGTFYVTLTVTDNDGATDSTTQEVSLSGGGDPTSLHVQSIVTGTENAGGGNKRGTATITIHDDLETPVSGATVLATFSGTFSEAASGQTGPDGAVTLTTAGTARGGVTVNICVNDVTHATLNYDAAQNDITCSAGN